MANALNRKSKGVGCIVAVWAATCVAGAGQTAEFSAADIYRQASPSVVVIFGFDATGAGSSGTGTLVNGTGMILTNHHVVFDPVSGKPYSNLQAYLKPSRLTGDDKKDLQKPYRARIVALDSALDLALVQMLHPPRDLEPIAVGDSEEIEVGESVAAIGHPEGGGLWTLTTGTISSTRRDGKRDIFQTDAAINPGNSGGPLLDANARLIGVNTFVRRVNRQGLPLEGLNYSLRSSLALGWMKRNGVVVAANQRVDDAPLRARQAPAAEPADSSPAQVTPAPHATPVPEPALEPALKPTLKPALKPALKPKPVPAPPEPRAFAGENGESMFGHPNRRFTLHEAMKDVYKAAIENANDAFAELDADFDDF
jgi:serine protease Do